MAGERAPARQVFGVATLLGGASLVMLLLPPGGPLGLLTALTGSTALAALAALAITAATLGPLAWAAADAKRWATAWPWLLAGSGAAWLAFGATLGLTWTPPEKFMGDVGRILYVHVPTAWGALVAFTLAMGFAVAYLWNKNPTWDAWNEAACEVGILLGALVLFQGSVWGRPTWGVWWDWDPRLTTTLILVLLFAGVLALRAFVDDPAQRATWAAVAAILAWVDAPIVYFSVKWWRSLHQMQSTPSTVDPQMVWVLRIDAFAVLFLALGWMAFRARIARYRQAREAMLEESP